MRWAVVAVVLVASTVLSGCSFIKPAHPKQQWDEAPDFKGGFRLGLNATQCNSATITFLIDPTTAARAVPRGFELRDAMDYAPLPTAKGQAALVLETTRCASYEFSKFASPRNAIVGMLIKPPGINSSLPQARFDFYALAHYEPDTSLTPFLVASGWPAKPADLKAEFAAASYGVPAQLATVDIATQGPQFSGLVADSESSRLDGISRFWLNGTHATAALDRAVVNAPSLAASMVSCSMAPNSVLRSYMNSDSCPADRTLGSITTGINRASSFWFLPHPKPAAS